MSGTGKDSSRLRLRQLPSVERLLEREGFRNLGEDFGRTELVDATRTVLSEIREALLEERIDEKSFEQAVDSIEEAVRSKLVSTTASSLISVVNATGIIVHTNLGRAPLSRNALSAINRLAHGYTNLEFDLAHGKRGRREQHAARLLGRLFPGFDAHVVNNNAAAVLLVLNTFAERREVIISRGELVEIGGSFRIPEILARSGATLREVGTTNKTRLSDYEEAIGASTGLILRVHLSNFRMIGFTESASTEELVALGRKHNLPVVEDFGSGNLLSLADCGLPNEPTVQASLEKGVDVATSSGDKLLGGPQAGIIVGSPEHVNACRQNHLARALRVDKLTYATLEATLSSYVREKAFEEIPVLAMLSASASEIETRSRDFMAQLKDAQDLALSLVEGFSKVGGGAAPEQQIPTWLIAVEIEGNSAQQVLNRLRAHEPPVIARIADDRVLLDLRTVLPDQEETVQSALLSLLSVIP
jgi:L-seryl-tRNA(Ser) seleniumtransferase